MAELIGRRLGRYEILDLVGAGGMGEVYRARDTELGREVAVKVLPRDLAGDRQRLARFTHEAQTVARLSHPNILEIHDFGTDGGILYAVTELLVGKDLRHRLGEGPLPVAKALEIGRAVAEGLAAAHSRGVVHRDVKPANIFVTSTGHVKILDFGIARLRHPAVADADDSAQSTDSATGPPGVAGTVGYMSPEQVRGQEVDARSDIFSFGCVFYEMLTGRRAFREVTNADTMLAVLTRDPPPVTALRPELPPMLDRIVRRCLEKQPEERFESARDVAFAIQAVEDDRTPSGVGARPAPRPPLRRALRWAAATALVAPAALLAWLQPWRGPPPLPQVTHLVVTRFAVAGEDPWVRQLADGLAETVTGGLTVLEEQSRGRLWVLPTRCVTTTDADPVAAMRRSYNVTLGVVGRLQRSGDVVRLTLEVVDASRGRTLRSAVVEEALGNLTAFQQAPTLRLAELLGVEVSPDSRQRLSADRTNLTSVLDAYLRGRGLLAYGGKESLDAAIELLAAASRGDPLFAAPRVALASACRRQLEATGDRQWLERGLQPLAEIREGSAEALSAAAALHRTAGDGEAAAADLERAVALRPQSAEAHLSLGLAYQALRRFPDAERELQHAVYLRPGYWVGHAYLARLYQVQGRQEAAVTQFREVIAAAPESVYGYNNLGTTYVLLERNDEARETFERSLAIEPNYFAFSNLGTIHFQSSRFADAIAMYRNALALDDSDYTLWGNLAYACASVDQPEEARRGFERAVELAEGQRRTRPRDPELLTDLAGYHALLGRRDEASRLLDLAVAEAPTEPAVMASIGEAFEDLGQRERALEWVARAIGEGYPHTWFEGRPLLRHLVADPRYTQLAGSNNRQE